MSTLWRGFASQFFLMMYLSNQSAFAAEALTGNVEKFELGGSAETAPRNGAVKGTDEPHNNGALNASTATSEFNLNADKGGSSLNSSAKGAGFDLNANQNSGTGLVLQGGVEDTGSLNHSLKLIPQGPSKSKVLSGEAKQTNYPIADAQDKPTPTKPVPFFPESVQANPPRVQHYIPPISSYTLSPRIGVLSAPGYNVPSVQTVKGVSSYVPGFEVSSIQKNDHIIDTQTTGHTEGITRSGGITAYTPAYGVHTMQTRYYGSTDSGPIYASKNGVTTYMPGFDIGLVPSITPTSGVMSSSNSKSATTHSGITAYVPGFEVAMVPTSKVTDTWHPGRVETVAIADFSKNTLSGVWYSPSAAASIPQLVAGTKALPVNREYVQPIVADDNRGLKAIQQVLSKPHSSMGADWDAWYEKIGHSIYSRWERAEVGPGSATIRITVDQSRNMFCEVVGFRPAANVDSDSVAETAFRVTALRAVNDLSQYEIPELPALSARKHSVTFDLEMSRAVNGPSGVIVAVPR